MKKSCSSKHALRPFGRNQCFRALSRRAAVKAISDGRCSSTNKLTEKCKQSIVAGLAAIALGVGGTALPASAMESSDFLDDTARILPAVKREVISQKLADLERDTGYRVRILTKVRYTTANLDAARAVWGVDNNTILLVFDPTSPNIFGYDYIATDILTGPLKRPFWIELQSRFGNMFYVRDYGESQALQAVVDTIDGCLRQGGCRRVPGLPDEQFYFTTILSALGGIILGFSSRLEPNDVISRRWIWPVLFSPLWASLYINFGLGPVISRTESWTPVAINTGIFLVAAALFRPNPIWFKEPEDS